MWRLNKRQQNEECKVCICGECIQNCNPELIKVLAEERVAQNIMYEQFGCAKEKKKRRF